MTLSPATEESLIESSTKFQPGRQINQIFYWITLVLAVGVGVVLLWISYSLLAIAMPSIQKFGLGFLASATWDPVKEIYGHCHRFMALFSAQPWRYCLRCRWASALQFS